MNYKRILSVLLVFVLLLLAVSCTPEQGTEDGTEGDVPASSGIVLIENGASDYQIVYSSMEGRTARQAATALSEALEEKTGVKLTHTADSAPAQDKEIVIGITNRNEDAVVPELADREIMLQAEGSKLFIYGVTEALIDELGGAIVALCTYEAQVCTLSATLPYRQIIEDPNEYIELTVGTYNLHEHGYHEIGGMGTTKPQLDLIAMDITAYETDVVCFQEIGNGTVESGAQDMLKVICDYLEEYTGVKYYYAYGVATKGTYTHEDIQKWANATHSDQPWGRPTFALPGSDWTSGVGIISKYPILSTKEHRLSGTGNNTVLLEAVLDIHGKEVPFLSSHNEQGIILTQLVETYAVVEDYPIYVLGGDFNWSTWSDFHYAFMNTITMVNDVHSNLQTTKNGYRFDNFIGPKDTVEFYDYEAHDTKHSDHFFLVTEVRLNFGQQ